MEKNNRTSITFAVILIGLGTLILILNLIPGLTFSKTWPIIFFVLAAGFFIPPVVWREARKGLSALFIPGSILLVLGLIFLYCTLTRDWVVWAYAWTLIPGGVGLGILLASWYGEWGQVTTMTGIWMCVISLMVFGLFGALFGQAVLKALGSILLILGGGLLLYRSLRKPKASDF
jgi:hypothetical protein